VPASQKIAKLWFES